MRSQNALFDRSGQETVLTDSVFFTHHSVYERLLRLHGELHPVSVELEAYGDFLSPLGRNPNRSYLESKSNLVDPYSANSVMSARTSVFEHLAGTPLHALPLEHSVFYHFGTTDEYLEHLCFGSKAKEGTVDRVGEDVVFTNRTGTNATFAPPGVTLMNTTFAHKGVQLNGVGHCVIENVVFGPNVLELNIGARSILSNLHVDLVVPGALNIPRGSYIFGVAVAEGFCSFAIDVDDDVKKTYPSRSEVRLWAGKLDANDVISLSGLEMNEALDGAPGNENSIWTAKIWPVLPSRMASFDFALGVAVLAASDASNRSHVHAVLPKDTQMMSIADAMEKKAPMELLRWQRACVGH